MLSWTFENCVTTIVCLPLRVIDEEETQCVMQYGTDPSFQVLSSTIIVPLNISTPLPLMEPLTPYYYELTTTNSSSTVRGNFTTEKCRFDIIFKIIIWLVVSPNNIHYNYNDQ